MADQKLELSRRKILGATGAVGAAGAAAGLGTSALFSDEESVTNNSIEAGTLDLIVDYTTEYDHSSTNQIDSGEINGDGATQYSYQLGDVKPGDEGTIVFCPKLVNNPGVLWFGSMAGITNYENGATEPEEDVDDSVSGNLNNGTNDGAPDGELGEKINATVSYSEEPTITDEDSDGDDDVVCNNYGSLSDTEAEITSGTLNEVIGDIATGIQVDGDPAASGDDDYPSSDGGDDQQGPCICIEWELPASVGNVIQSDAVEFDLTFIAEQARNNASPENPFPDFVIQDWGDLDDVRNRLDEDIRLLNDLNLNTAEYETVGADDGTFSPIGGVFTGTFDGDGNTISNLNIDASNRFAGLFSAVAGTVESLTLDKADVTSTETFLGVLAGNFGGTVQNVTVTDSSVTTPGYAGGLVGVLNNGTIQGASVSMNVSVESDPNNTSPQEKAGGVAGASVGGTIANSETSGTVKGQRHVGGVVGFLQRGTTTITGTVATGKIEGTEYSGRKNGQNIGGLIGAANATGAGNPAGSIEESYTTATVKGTENVGGLLGDDTNGPAPITIKRSYSTANIESTGGFAQQNIGGLVGKGAPDIDNSYAAPTITTDANNSGTSAGNVGGVVGSVNDQSETDGTDTYWDTVATSQSSAVGNGSLTATGLTTTQMQGSNATSSMSGIDFTNVWQTNSGDYPTLL